MPFAVWLTDGAARDLEDLHGHIAAPLQRRLLEV